MATLREVREVTFDQKKHSLIRKGSMVGEKGITGYLVYPMPPVGILDPTTDLQILKDIRREMVAEPGFEVNAGSAKAVRKVYAKA